MTTPAAKGHEKAVIRWCLSCRRKVLSVKKKIGVVHAVATCADCGKEFQNFLNAQALAAQHAKKYGHVVNGELGIAFTYDGSAGR